MPKIVKVDILCCAMKDGIHPKLHNDCKVACACGNSFTTISTVEKVNVEICSMCHPFYTGQQKFIDTEGRIDKFVKKRKVSEDKKIKADKVKIAKEKKKKKKSSTDSPPSLKEMLEKARKQTS